MIRKRPVIPKPIGFSYWDTLISRSDLSIDMQLMCPVKRTFLMDFWCNTHDMAIHPIWKPLFDKKSLPAPWFSLTRIGNLPFNNKLPTRIPDFSLPVLSFNLPDVDSKLKAPYATMVPHSRLPAIYGVVNMQQNFSVRTFEELMAMRVLTGVTRINEHHLSNNLSNSCTSHGWLVANFGHEDLMEVYDNLAARGFVVELRHDRPEGIEIDGADLESNIDASFNAFRVVDEIVTTLLNVVVSGNSLVVTAYQIRREPNYFIVIEDLIKSKIIQKPIKLRYICGFEGDSKAITDLREISNDQHRPIDEFYPQLVGGIAKLAEDFKNSSNNLLFMMSRPGTGKSTLIRELCRIYRDRPLIQFAGEKVIGHPGFDSMIAKLPLRAVCIIEDADVLVAKRTEGNTSMSLLLNEIDGIASKGIKFIISTNLENRKHVDEALFRPGRCFATLEFGLLTKEQAMAIDDKMDLRKSLLIETSRELTLAKLLADGGDDKAATSGPGFNLR